MRNLRMRGGAAAAIVAAAAMVLSTFAIAPANAADTDSCPAATQSAFEEKLGSANCSTINISGNSDGVLKFNEKTGISVDLVSYNGYDKPAEYTIDRPVTITSNSQVVMRNVQFNVVSGGSLTFAGSVILDDVGLAGMNLVDLLNLVKVGIGDGSSLNGIPYGVRVGGTGTFTMAGNSNVVVGTGHATAHGAHAIEATGESTINLTSEGLYERSNQKGLVAIEAKVLGVGGISLAGIVLNLLTVNRSGEYPTVWGRDAAVYSEPDAATTINITNGSYTAAKSALLLNGASTTNIISGTIASDSSNTKAVELASGAKVNILAQKQGDVNIGGTQYYIQDPQVSGSKFTSAVSPTGPASTDSETDAEISADENEYNLWLGGAAAGDSMLNTLSNLVNDSARKKLDTSYASDGTSMNAYAAPAAGQSVYGRKVVATGTSASPFEGVNGGTAGTVTLYGAPYTAASKPALTAPTKDGQLFAGWYTSGSAYTDEEKLQRQALVTSGFQCVPNASKTDPGTDVQGRNPKHHCWVNGSTTYPNKNTTYGAEYPSNEDSLKGSTDPRIVVSPNYSGSLYPHFVSADTLSKTYVQLEETGTQNGKKLFSVRFLSGVDSYNFQNAGFTVEKKTDSGFTGLGTAKSKMLYDFITAQGGKQVFTESPYAGKDGYATNMLGTRGDARYLTTLVLKKVPEGSTVRVTPQWTTLDGTVVTGTPVTFTVQADNKVAE